MELGLSGKTALVTGSSRGIGAGIALALAEEGCNVVLTGRDGAALDAVAASARAKHVEAAVVALDLREAHAPATLLETARDAFGGLDILVNNAGSTKRGDFFALDDADWQDGFGLKLFAHVRLARAAWPLLKERRGSLVTIGGTSGRKPHASFTIGSSVNAACAAFTKALADLGKQDGVQVNCIHPEAVIRGRFCTQTGITRFGTTQDVAGLVCFIVSQNGGWLHGATIDLDGGEIPVL
jgi:3-oxoacyl-[acyl-carrier protein] reductase